MTPRPSPPQPWHAASTEEVLRRLEVVSDRGLSRAEAEARRAEHGENRLEAQGRVHWWQVLARQFVDVLIGILVMAAVLSALVGEAADSVTIVAIVLLNGALGFVQEWRAEQAMVALQRMLSPQSRVLREGVEQVVDASGLVPGDVVVLGLGDRVPADLRLLRCQELTIDESALTGESEPVAKATAAVAVDTPLAERRPMAMMGTAVTNGHGRGVVVATGMQTELGAVARMTRSVQREPTPLQRSLGTLGRQLGLASLGVALAVGLVGWLAGQPPVEMLLTGIALAVAIVPEGLPAVVTLTLALGTRAMLRRRALLRRLQAAESLGAATVICTDKTGTLTRNEMTVQQVRLPAPSGESWSVEVDGLGYAPEGDFSDEGRPLVSAERLALEHLLEAALACSNARVYQEAGIWRQVGVPTEAALVVAATKAGLDRELLPERLAELPFDSTRKRMSVVVERDGQRLALVKGAPEVLVQRCSHWRRGDVVEPLGVQGEAWVTRAVEVLSEKGLRTLAVAERRLPPELPLEAAAVEEQLVLLGVVGIIDPPRREVGEAIARAAEAGIRTIMITGDALGTARAVGQRVGLDGGRALSGADVDALDDEALAEALEGPVIFARTTPAHKLRIVRALQARGQVVAMTGDGVNDAPALKQADVGISMGQRGTEVARGASDMVLTDDNYASIVGAVEEGRRQYDNIKKFVRYLLSSNTGEVLALLANILVGGPLLLLPVQILWMNLVTDGLTALALGLEPAEDRVMQQPPRDPQQHILDLRAVAHIAVLGLWIGGATLYLYMVHGDPEVDLDRARTLAFAGMVVIEKVNVLSFRSLRSPWVALGVLGNPWLLVAWLATILLQVGVVYLPPLQVFLHTVPLALSDWALIFAVAAPIFVIPELLKLLQRAREDSRPR